ALDVAPGIADENQAIPGDWSGRGALALAWVRDRRGPDALSGLEIVGENPAVLGAAEQHAIQIRRAAIDALRRGRLVILMRAPILATRRRIDRERVVLGDKNQRAVHLQQARRKAGVLPGIIRAENLEPVGVCSVDLA